MSEPLPDTTLPPDSAAKVLGADLRNSVAQVAAGQRLPEADRARLETTVLTDADPDTVARLARERQANLLKIWSTGRRRLNPAELKELEPILPREILARPPTKKAGYQHPLAHYVEIYQAAERTLKHWIALGRQAQPEPDLPPLDEPAQMKAWYARHKKNRVPDHLVQLAAQSARLETADPGCPPWSSPPPAAACGNVTTAATSAVAATAGSVLPSAPPTPRVATGFSATLERLRDAEAAAGSKYTELILAGKDAEAEVAERRWQKLRNDLRAYERDAQEVLAAQGKLWPADEVTAVLHEIHTPLRDGVLALFDRIESQLDTLPRNDRRKLYRGEVNRLFAALVANKFTAPPAPDLAAA
jgi:hypothetical protein